ncbi:MAG: hypothetical protein MPJ24_07745 [Pirellulaceae bacterium]|nr:hypothetical protein [Pirellulaceae bacterium]
MPPKKSLESTLSSVPFTLNGITSQTPSPAHLEETVPSSAKFDFTAQMRLLCNDVTTRLPEMRHIQMERVALSYTQTRKAVLHGVHATLTPLRFLNGSKTTKRSGKTYYIPPICDEQGQEYLYVLDFYMPRFLETNLKEKLITVFHELWHISPNFDGDIRRFQGRCYAHSGSQKNYDRLMEKFVCKWLARKPPAALYHFLQFRFAELKNRVGRIYGLRIPKPKLHLLAS